MKYSIIICPRSQKSIAIEQAYQLIEAILQDSQKKDPHEVHVFFYGLAVNSAFSASKNWQHIAQRGVKLNVCSILAESHQAKQKLASYFLITGMGQWMESTIDADKNIELV